MGKISKSQSPNTPQKQETDQQRVALQFQAFNGPLPPPDILQRYDEISPGAAQIIIQVFQDEVSHRHSQEVKAIEADIRDRATQINRSFDERRLGQIFAFMICSMMIGGGIYLASLGSLGKEIAGGLLSTTGMAAIAYVFITGRRRPKE